MSNLYIITIGGSMENSNIEVHDILFIVAESIEQTYDLVRKSWYGTKKSLHIDSYKILKDINGYCIQLSTTRSEENLYLIVYGGQNLVNLVNHTKSIWLSKNQLKLLV